MSNQQANYQVFNLGQTSSNKSNLKSDDFPALGGGASANIQVQAQQTMQMQGQNQFNGQQQMQYQDPTQMYGGGFQQQQFAQQQQQYMPNQMYMQQPMFDQFGNPIMQMFDQQQQQFMMGNTGGMNWGMPQQQQYIGGVNQTQSLNAQFQGLGLANDTNLLAGQQIGLGQTQSVPLTTSTFPTLGATTSNTTVQSNTTQTSFKLEATEFVPKKKIVKTVEQFPTLDMAATKEPVKKKVVTTGGDQPTKQASNSSDPTHGKSKEFFLIYPDNPQMPADPFLNPLMPNEDQMVFIFTYYPEYSTNPADLIIWLYQTAQFNEEQARLSKIQQDTEGAYKIKPKIGARLAKGNRRKQYDDEEEEEDVVYGAKNLLKKPKPQPAPPKELSQEQLEKMKIKNEQKKADKLKLIREKEARSINSKVRNVAEDQIVEVDETRQPASLVCIGHVDAGKSTISGNLMFIMGAVDQRTIQKYKEEAKENNRESWWLAYVMDVNEEEKAKGKTVEIGRANIETPKKRWTIFDAPGHKNYVPNMIMGAALADFGCLVISAKKGEFESGFDMDGQTREHIQLAKSLGIYKLVVAVNKMDEPSVKWSKDRYTDILTSLKPFIKGCGYDPETDCIYVPLSGLNGDNIKEQVSKTVCNWYNGPTLLEILDDLELPPRNPDGPLRIPILDKMRDRGTVIFGKVESGTVKVGDQLNVMPQNLLCQVATVYNSKGEAVKYAKPGENVQLRLLNINDENLVNKGDVLCKIDEQIPITDLFEAEIDVLELLKYKPILSKGYQCILHIHTVAEEATIKEILVSYEKNDKGEIIEKQKPQFTQSFSRIICRVQVRIPIPLEKHDFLEQMGRFTLRDEGKTIAVGKVLKYKPVKVFGTANNQGSDNANSAQNVQKEDGKVDGNAESQINTKTKQDANKAKEELVYDLDSGEMVTREEFNRRNQERQEKEMEGIDENEDEDDEEDDDEEDGKQ